MATGTIKTGTAQIAYLTDVTSGVSTYGKVVKDPTTSTVRIFVVARSSSDMTGQTVLARIPNGFRPKQNEAIYGIIAVGGTNVSTYYGIAYPNGEIKQSLSSSARACYFSGEYEI